MLIIKLAYKNLVGAGLKTWLKVAVLSLTYVIVVWLQGLYHGMLRISIREMIKDEVAGGHYWHEDYDQYDFITINDSHGAIPEEVKPLIKDKKVTPVLIWQASIFPEGRVQTILMKGIEPSQSVLGIPTSKLNTEEDILPVMVGARMAKKNLWKVGDSVTIRWRDQSGVFDAVEAEVVEIMKTQVPTIDFGQIWVPVNRLQSMTDLYDEATMIVVGEGIKGPGNIPGWDFKDQDYLLKDFKDAMFADRISSGIMLLILLILAMIAIFDTQVLSIFRRKKEIGTLMALGLIRTKVIALFTLEGALIGVLSAAVASIYGVPLMYWTVVNGIGMPEGTDEYGFAIGDKMYPAYPIGLVVIIVAIIMIVTTIVSYIPARRIARLKPTEALKSYK